MTQLDTASLPKPVIEHQKFDVVRRNLTVRRVQELAPNMLRITLGGDELAGFNSPSSDDHIKLFIPVPGGEPAARDYTPRHFDSGALELSIDFALHGSGAATTWARQAKPGDAIQIAGPRGSKVIKAPDAWWLLIGDESALPATGRRLEEMAAGTRVITVAAVRGPEEELRFETKANLTPIWVHRPIADAADPAPFLKAVAALDLPAGPGFVWIGAEGEVARALREYFINERGISTDWIKAASYWSKNGENKK
jgi:NADPH-dependent ferric siderophore reductase